MIQYTKVQDKLLGLIGWSGDDGSGVTLSGDIIRSESGLFYQQAHPLLTLRNISNVAPEFEHEEYPEFNPDSDYSRGDIVSYNGVLYIASSDISARVPVKEGELLRNTDFRLESYQSELYNRNSPTGDGYATKQPLPPFDRFKRLGIKHWNTCMLSKYDLINPVRRLLPVTDIHTVTLASRGNDDRRLYQVIDGGLIPGARYRLSVSFAPNDNTDKYMPHASINRVRLGVGCIFDKSKLGDIPEGSAPIRSNLYELDAVLGEGNPIPRNIQNFGAYKNVKYGDAIEVTGKVRSSLEFTAGTSRFKGKDYTDNAIFIGTSIGGPPYTGERMTALVYNPSLIMIEGLPSVPPDSNNLWELYTPKDPLAEWLKSKTVASIQRVITRFCNEKVVGGTMKNIFENRLLFSGAGRPQDSFAFKQRIAGLELVPPRVRGVALIINRIGLQFTKPGLYRIYIMNSAGSGPYRVFEFNKASGAGSIEWFDTGGLCLPYTGDGIEPGGSWFVCYQTFELPEESRPIRKDRDWSKAPCSACSRADMLEWQAWSRYVEVHPFYNGSMDLGSWDSDKSMYAYDNNFGLNIDMTLACDFTDFIIDNRHLFIDVLMRQVAVDLLREFAYNANARTNRNVLNASRIDIMRELDGSSDSNNSTGLNYQLDLAYKALRLSTSGFYKPCMPCNNNGIKYRST
jgi:hypothetical protein